MQVANQLYVVLRPFLAHDGGSARRVFDIGDELWLDFDETGEVAEFTVDGESWFTNRAALKASVYLKTALN